MSPQADYVVANGTGAAVRSDINGQLAAIVSNNSGASAPATTYAYMLWADTSTNLLKLRNGANSAWITVGDLTAANLGLASLASPTFTGTVTIPTLTVSTGANIPLGTAASPTLYFTGDTNTGLYSPGADQVAVATNGSERLRIGASGQIGLAGANYGTSGQVITSNGSGSAPTWQTISSSQWTTTGSDIYYTTGRVGIGSNATSPTQQLHVRTDQAAYTWARIDNQSSSASAYSGLALAANGNTWGLAVGSSSANSNALAFVLDATGANSEKMRLDTSGRLLVGTSTTSSTALFQVQGNSSSSTGGAILQLRRGTNNVGIVNNTALGSIEFSNTESTVSAVIAAEADANWNTTNDYPSRLTFSTTADGASSPTERMRISNSGDIFINKTSTSTSTVGVAFEKAGSIYATRDGDYCGWFNRLNSDGTIILFQRSSTGVGSISVGVSSTAYNTTSDYRLKENIEPVTDGITRLQQLKPSRFNFIAEPGKTVDGFLAHEVQDVVPEAIIGTKDEVDADGNPIYQGIDQSKLAPLLTAALQEAVARIEQLEAAVTALQQS